MNRFLLPPALLSASLVAAAIATPYLKEQPVTVYQSTDKLPTKWYDGGIWNWHAKFAASQWPAPFSRLPFEYDHVRVLKGGDVQLRLDDSASAEIQARLGTPVVTAGLFEVDVDLPKAKPGVIQAPLWLFDKASGDEADFEIVGIKGMQVNVHVGGKENPFLLPGDWSGRHRLAIRMNQAQGIVEMSADGTLLKRFDAATSKLMISHPLKPMMSIWAVDPANTSMTGWSGVFPGFAAGEGPMYLTIHGYRFTAG